MRIPLVASIHGAWTLVFLLGTAWLLGCASPEESSNDTAPPDTNAVTAQLTEAQDACMITVVNSCYYDAQFFDYDLKWDRRAAEGLAQLRSGPDGLCGTSDDHLFSDAVAIDAIPYVGDRAMELLLDFVISLSCTETVAVVEGVGFSQAQAAATLEAVNLASRAQLENDAKLAGHATKAVLSKRPFTTTVLNAGLHDLAGVKYIGPATLRSLRDYGAVFLPDQTSCADLETTIDGVHFTANQAFNVLDLVNYGLVDNLVRISEIGPILADRILAAGPHADIHELSKTKGLGVTRLQNLRDDVGGSWCVSGSSSCGCNTATRAAILGALEAAETLLGEHKVHTTSRFYILLGPENYTLLAQQTAATLAGSLWTNPPEPGSQFEAAAKKILETHLNQALFTNPFTAIQPTRATANDFKSSLQTAVDALIVKFNSVDLESTDVGVSFADLIADEAESYYLDDLSQWRNWSGDTLNLVELSHSWLFSGQFVGIDVQVTVSRQTGTVLGVELF